MNKQELARRIVRDMGYDYQTVRNIIDGTAFEGWLHDPDQVPGRTITESEIRELWKAAYSKPGPADANFARLLGITVVPDPEPTIPVPSESGVRFIAYSPEGCDDCEDQHEFVVAGRWIVNVGNDALFDRDAFGEDWTVTSIVKAPEAGGDDDH